MFIRHSTSCIHGIFDFHKLQIKFVDVEQTEKKFLEKKPEDMFWHDISRSCVARSEVSKWQPATVWISIFDVNSFWCVSTNLFVKEVEFESKKSHWTQKDQIRKWHHCQLQTSKGARNVKSLLGKCSVHLSELPH